MKQQEFLEGVSDPDNHRPLLWLAFELTKESKLPVAEFGAGYGSTKYLRQYCNDEKREFVSFDSNAEWAKQWSSIHTDNWLDPNLYKKYSVVLIDQAPGEYRHESMKILKEDAEIIVVHDAEPDYSMGYRLEEIWHLFKYRVFVKGEKIWSAAVSNHINLEEKTGQSIGNFKIEY